MTAVECLVEKFNQCEPMFSGIQSDDHKQYIDSLIEQAKKMEKKQIENAKYEGYVQGWDEAANYIAGCM